MILALANLALAGTWDTEHQVAVTWFPKGLRYAFSAEYQVPVWQSDSILFQDTIIAPGTYAELTPAYARGGARVHFVPLAILDITAEALATGYFGTFSGVTDFDSADADYSEKVFDSGEIDDRRNAGFGFKYGITPTLQAKVGKFIVAMPQEFTRFTMFQPDDARGAYWYEPQYDVLMKWDDTLMLNSALAFWAFREKTDDDARMFWLGARFDHLYVFGTEDRQLKLGPMMVWRPSKSLAVPTIVVFTQLWIESRIHPIAPPYMAGAAIW